MKVISMINTPRIQRFVLNTGIIGVRKETICFSIDGSWAACALIDEKVRISEMIPKRWRALFRTEIDDTIPSFIMTVDCNSHTRS